MMRNRLALGVLLLAAIIWGFGFVAMNSVSDTLPPFAVNATRSVIAFSFLLPVVAVSGKVRGKAFFEQSATDRAILIKAGVLCGSLLCVSMNLQQFGVMLYPDGAPAEAHSGFLTALYILFVPAFGVFINRRPGPFVIIGIVIAIIGLYMLCFSDGVNGLYVGDLVVLLCGMSFALLILCVDHYVDRVDEVKLCAVQFFVSGFISTILMFAFESIRITMIMSVWKPLLYLGVFSSAGGYTLQFWGQKYAKDPTLASIVMSMESVFAMLGGIIFMGVVPNKMELFGCVVIFIAVIIAQLPANVLKNKDGKSKA